MAATITEYCGEFLINPAPLELSLNRCTYNCIYCFAIANAPMMKADEQAVINQLSGLYKTKSVKGAKKYKNNSLASRLLRAKYPLVFSNRADPFAHSNIEVAANIINYCNQYKIPINWQTKSGDLSKIKALVKGRAPEVWYISISFDNDEMRKKIELNAPPLETRWELIKWLKSQGHHVIVGINPLVPEWINDIETLCNRLKEAGVHGIWIEFLHLNYKQRSSIEKNFSRNYSQLEPWVKGAMTVKGFPDNWLDFKEQTLDAAEDAELEFFMVGAPWPTQIFKPWRECYEKTFPTIPDFHNYLWDFGVASSEGYRIFTIKDWLDFFEPKLPKIISTGLHNYIRSTTQAVQIPLQLPSKLGYRNLMKSMFHPKIRTGNPLRWEGFGYAMIGSGEKADCYVDEEGFPLFVYSPYGFATNDEGIDCRRAIKELDGRNN